MVAPILVMTVGNESRGDDALGPLLARQIESNLNSAGLADKVEFIEDFQWQIECALDLIARDLVLFIDAGHHTHAPFSFYQARASKLESHTSHAISPEALLQVYTGLYHAEPPSAFVLCVAGTAFVLGEPLSKEAELHLAAAFEFCQQLFKQSTYADWLELAQRSEVQTDFCHDAV